jgi:hypothetical protein
MSNENAEQRPRLDGVEQRSASSLIFQSLDAVGDVGLGVGTALLGAAAWKATGSQAPEQHPQPPPEPPPSKPAE